MTAPQQEIAPWESHYQAEPPAPSGLGPTVLNDDLYTQGGNGFFGLHPDLRLTYRQSRPMERQRLINAMTWEGSTLPPQRFLSGRLHELWRGDEVVGLFAIEAKLLAQPDKLQIKAHLGLCYLIEELRGKGIGREAITGIATQLVTSMTDSVMPQATAHGERLPIEIHVSTDMHNRRGEMIADLFCELMLVAGDLIHEQGLPFIFDARDCL